MENPCKNVVTSADLDRERTNKTIHILRNPSGWSEEEVREARLYAATLLDSVNTPRPYAIDPVQMAEAMTEASRRGKWSLVSPDGQAWIGRDLPVIATVALAAMGGTLQQEIENGTEKEQCSPETGSQAS